MPGDITHYYFSNFPERWGEKELWKVFERYERVWEVFISPKRDKNGRRFGFVRFYGVKNPRRLEQDLDSITIGCTKMHVNFPRFEKLERKTHNYARIIAKHSTSGSRVDRSQQLNNLPPKKSYAQVLKTGQDAGNRVVQKDPIMLPKEPVIEIEEWNGPVIQKEEDWLKRSMVGLLKDIDVVASLQDVNMLKGFQHIQIRYLGADMVLLTGPEDFDLAGALEESGEGMKEVFDVVFSWSRTVAPDFRVTWVRCSGFPIHMWSRDCFDELIKPVGELVGMDSNTTSFSNLEFARLQIKTYSKELISQYRRIRVRGVEYKIRIFEEHGGMVNVNCRCVELEDTSIESEDLDDDFCGSFHASLKS